MLVHGMSGRFFANLGGTAEVNAFVPIRDKGRFFVFQEGLMGLIRWLGDGLRSDNEHYEEMRIS